MKVKVKKKKLPVIRNILNKNFVTFDVLTNYIYVI